jgi:branched-chain amino acid transport system permease protein
MRAAAAAPEQSRLVGIPVEWMLLAGWGVAAALGAIAGVLIAPRLFVSPGMMLGVVIYAFAAATLGGFDSVLGAVIGGLVVGVAENMAATYIPWIGADLKIVVALVIIFATLLVRPSGLFGRKNVVRV